MIMRLITFNANKYKEATQIRSFVKTFFTFWRAGLTGFDIAISLALYRINDGYVEIFFMYQEYNLSYFYLGTSHQI